MTKNPKFFCQNCNAEVRRDAMICPHCGRFFASVRCPSCGFTGTHKEFKNGCPSCGYTLDAEAAHAQNDTSAQNKTGNPKFFQHKNTVRQHRTDSDPLPLWIYGLVLSLAAVLCSIFFYYS